MDDKKIIITGTNNRYQIKKATEKRAPPKKRAEVEKWSLEEDYYTAEKQLSLLNQNPIYPLLVQQIERKIQGYKQQDLDKALFDTNKFIQFEDVVQFLLDARLGCYYCKKNMLLLYKNVREGCQWTLDRINNDLGHNTDNVFVSCLECNLKRRRCNADKFLFTKQMVIVRL